ncbi:MAG: acyl-CoA dehydrogenase family protein, partial [Deltaproteobacteria bacterium]|nr:acyl-CoA dehydrogenase family protein [Deltaproteobacteria bacterium]
MDFTLGEEDQLLRDTVREWCDQKVRPHAAAWDEARALPAGLLEELGQMGLLAMEQPESEGGAGLSTVAATALIEELGAADGSLALVVSAHNCLGLAHAAAGLEPNERARLRPAMVEGQQLVTLARSSDADGTAGASHAATRARREGDGWVLDGTETYVPLAAIAQQMVVLATTDPAPTDADTSVVAFLVDASTQGVEVGEPVRTLG